MTEKVDTTDPTVRIALQRANQVAGTVDTILVHPDSLVLHVGQTMPLFGTLTIEARDSSGKTLWPFAPWIAIEDHSIAELGGGGVVGRHPGTTRIIIRPLSYDPSIATKRTQAVVALRVEP